MPYNFEFSIAVQKLNRLLLTETDIHSLMQCVCDSLASLNEIRAADLGHYHDVSGAWKPMAESGQAQKAAWQDFPLPVEVHAPVTLRLASERGELFTHPALKLLAGDLAFRLDSLSQADAAPQLAADLATSRHALGERIKELKCLYAISRLVQKEGIALNEIFRGALQFIPPAWQYPDITCASIRLEEDVFSTDNFNATAWMQSEPIVMNGAEIGAVDVGYLEARPEADEGPFLKEERALLSTIADRLGKAAEYLEMRHKLEASESSFRDLVENALMGIVILADGQVAYMNSEQKRISQELPLAFARCQWDMIHAEDRDEVMQRFEAVEAGEVSRMALDFRFYPAEAPGEVRWVSCRAHGVTYQGGRAILLNMLDITRSRHLEGLLRVKDKMASLGHVAAGIAHEIRNPLSGINIYLNALNKINTDHGTDDRVEQIISQMQSASGKIESIIKRVMDFSRPTEPKRKWIDINEPIEDAAQLSSVTLRKIGIDLVLKLTPELPAVYADGLLLEQVLLNLITNAAEAMKETQGAKRIEIATALADGRFRITVSDSGPGVPQAVKEKIFDPFFSTKSGNTGIGLSLGHRIITDHGGTLDVKSSDWGGARFIIDIPQQKRR